MIDVKTLVVAPMPEEVRVLRRRLNAVSKVKAGDMTLHHGRLVSESVAVAVLGEGADRARRALQIVFATVTPQQVICIGVAGGLVPQLRPGAVLVAQEIHDATRELSFRSRSADALAPLAKAMGGRVGSLLVSPAMLLSVAEKLAFRDAHNVSGPSAVDMESSAIVAAVLERGLPCLVVRAMSDSVEEALPRFIADCRTPDGRIDRTQLVRRALLRPGAWLWLVGLKKRVDHCAEHLADMVTTVVVRGGFGGGTLAPVDRGEKGD